VATADAHLGDTSITGIVVAAGRSTRMGRGQGESKLLLPWADGRSIVETTVEALLASAVDEVIVVIGHDRQRIASRLESYSVRLVNNDDYEAGLSASIRCGVEAAGTTSRGFLIALADMPRIAPTTIDVLCNRLAHAGPDAIVVPVMDGRRGHPVVFGQDHRAGLLTLSGDKGARGLMEANTENVFEVAVNDSGIFADVDTPQAYEALRDAGPTPP